MKRRLTIRTRLMPFYGGLFLLAGMVQLGVTYALISQRMRREASFSRSGPPPDGVPLPGPGGTPERDVNLSHTPENFQQDVLEAVLTQGGIALGVVGAVAIAFG